MFTSHNNGNYIYKFLFSDDLNQLKIYIEDNYYMKIYAGFVHNDDLLNQKHNFIKNVLILHNLLIFGLRHIDENIHLSINIFNSYASFNLNILYELMNDSIAFDLECIERKILIVEHNISMPIIDENDKSLTTFVDETEIIEKDVYVDSITKRKKYQAKYYKDNINKLKMHHKLYYINNKEKLNKNKQIHYKNNKNQYKVAHDFYYENNKDKIKKHKSKTYVCNTCGKEIVITNKYKHKCNLINKI